MATITDVKEVGLEDSGCLSWRVSKQEIHTVGGEDFFLLGPRNPSLKRLVLAKYEHPSASCNSVKHRFIKGQIFLTHFEGYKIMKEARTKANTIERSQPDDSNAACSLFGTTSPETSTKAKKLKKIRDMDPALNVVVSCADVQKEITMLRPTGESAKLYIHADSASLANAIDVLRAHGICGEAMLNQRDVTLPKGVWKKRGKFFLKQTMASTKRKQTFSCIEDAQAALADAGDGDVDMHDGGAVS